MDSKYETSSLRVCFLNESYFNEVYHAFIRAFADYVMPFEMTEEQFRNHIVLNAVDPAFRGQGIGTRFLQVMATDTDDRHPLQVINIDRSIENAIKFFENREFAEKLSQFEMLTPI